MKASAVFVFLAAVGVVEALYHALLENAFTTNLFAIQYSVHGSFFGIPYWLFGVVWYPIILVVGVWTTRFGRTGLRSSLILLLSLGNLFTVYLWYLDILVVGAFTPVYVGLYTTNYALTGIVVAQNWSRPSMRDFVIGTIVGTVVGVSLGPVGVAAFGIFGGIVGSVWGETTS